MSITQEQLDRIEHPDESNGDPNATRVITVRMPQTLHAALKKEAHRCETSLNRLALAKLRIAGDALANAVELAGGAGT